MKTIELDVEKNHKLESLSNYLKSKKIKVGEEELQLKIRGYYDFKQIVYASFLTLPAVYFLTKRQKKVPVNKPECTQPDDSGKVCYQFYFRNNDVKKLESKISRQKVKIKMARIIGILKIVQEFNNDMRNEILEALMFRPSLMLVFLIILGCSSRKEPTYSFNINDYVHDTTLYNDEKIKLGDVFVNKYNRRLTLRRHFYDNDSLMGEIFYLDRDKFGPYRYYNPDGTLAVEVIYYGKLDSTQYTYDRTSQTMKKNKK